MSRYENALCVALALIATVLLLVLCADLKIIPNP